MRSVIALLGVVLGGCNLDASGLGNGDGDGPASDSGTTRGSSETVTPDTSVGTEHGSLSSSGPPADDGPSSTGGSSSPSTSSEGPSTGDDATTGNPPAPLCQPADTLAACYDFANVGAGTLLDLSGNGNDAPAVGVGVVPGPFGEAATFDQGSQISVADSPSLDIPGPLTIEAWVMVDALPGTGRMGVLDDDGQYSLIIFASDEYRCDMGGQAVFVGPVVIGEWTHVACVLEGAELRAYVNGTELGMIGGANPAATISVEPISIGDTSPDFDEPLGGALGGLRVWSRALDAAELCEAAGDACRG